MLKINYLFQIKRNDEMLNVERLKMEVRGITLESSEWEVYLLENDLIANELYQANNSMNKKQVLQAALSILESVANNPTTMKDYAVDDMTVSQFHENLMARIDQLQTKINNIKVESIANENGSFFMLFND